VRATLDERDKFSFEYYMCVTHCSFVGELNEIWEYEPTKSKQKISCSDIWFPFVTNFGKGVGAHRCA